MNSELADISPQAGQNGTGWSAAGPNAPESNGFMSPIAVPCHSGASEM
ncbi:MAG TPA: hypothetical protein VHO29_06605 [Marmoricola sp.]|nr:hypothetical protein [Marmoricola sp.]